MLGKAPYTFTYVPTFCSDYVEIPGTGIDAMTNRYTYRIPEQQNLWEATRIILRRLRTTVNTPMVGINERGQSIEDHSEYNILREAMANQMAHADHFSLQRSCIHVFDDRIEFVNPGAMPKPIGDMEHSFESLPRNPIIAKLFRLAHLSENLGYGLRKLKSWQDVTGCPVHIETTVSSVKVTFGLKKIKAETTNVGVNVGVKLTDTQLKVLELLKQSPTMTHAEVAKKLSVTIKTAERTTKALREFGIVKREGSDKSGIWIFIGNNKA